MRVKTAEYIKDYRIRLLFSDGVTKVVDFTPLLKDAKNLLIPLLDLEYFKSFSVDSSTICWPNEVDFCPDVLYAIGKEERSRAERSKHTPGRAPKRTKKAAA